MKKNAISTDKCQKRFDSLAFKHSKEHSNDLFPLVDNHIDRPPQAEHTFDHLRSFPAAVLMLAHHYKARAIVFPLIVNERHFQFTCY